MAEVSYHSEPGGDGRILRLGHYRTLNPILSHRERRGYGADSELHPTLYYKHATTSFPRRCLRSSPLSGGHRGHEDRRQVSHPATQCSASGRDSICVHRRSSAVTFRPFRVLRDFVAHIPPSVPSSIRGSLGLVAAAEAALCPPWSLWLVLSRVWGRTAYLQYTAKEVVDILGVFHHALDIDRYI